MPAEVVQTMPCGLCRELIAHPENVRVDTDLEIVVCAECGYRLRGAAAWLKRCGLPQCRKIPHR